MGRRLGEWSKNANDASDAGVSNGDDARELVAVLVTVGVSVVDGEDGEVSKRGDEAVVRNEEQEEMEGGVEEVVEQRPLATRLFAERREKEEGECKWRG